MSAAEYHDIGSYLKDSRESLGISVHAAAQALHLRIHYIEAIESGKFDALPGKAYVRGYIRNYALFLGIDPAELLEVYDSLTGQVRQELFIPEPTVQEYMPSRLLLTVAVAGAVLLLAYYLVFRDGDRIQVPRVADVPVELMFAAEALKSPRAAPWEQCLNTGEMGCYNMLFQQYYFEDFQKESYRVMQLLAGI